MGSGADVLQCYEIRQASWSSKRPIPTHWYACRYIGPGFCLYGGVSEYAERQHNQKEPSDLHCSARNATEEGDASVSLVRRWEFNGSSWGSCTAADCRLGHQAKRATTLPLDKDSLHACIHRCRMQPCI